MTNLTELQQRGRAKNAVSAYFEKRLIVPKIFLDADWDGKGLDVLAIDRAGAGDAHAVRLVPRYSFHGDGASDVPSVRAIIDAHEDISEMKVMFETPCQYRYVGIFNVSQLPVRMGISEKFKSDTFAADGVGRIGLLEIDLLGDLPRIEEVIRAERFRSTKHILELTDKFVISHTADAEYRDPIYDQEVSG
jgi:hypothetical protein